MADQPGALPIWALNGRPSASADAARLVELERLRAMTPRERMALALGLSEDVQRLQSWLAAGRAEGKGSEPR